MASIAALYNPPAEKAPHKDKMAERKANEKAAHEQHQLELKQEKEKNNLDRDAERAAAKFEREFNMHMDPEHAGRRAHREAKEKAHQDEKKTHVKPVCEHGIEGCRVCFPPQKHK